MLKKRYRFHSRGGVKYTYQKGSTIRTPEISLVYANNSRNHQRFGVVVSKKVLKSAVSRNRIRRRVYEAIRLELPDFSANLDCLFIINRKDIINIPFRELRYNIKQLLSRATSNK